MSDHEESMGSYLGDVHSFPDNAWEDFLADRQAKREAGLKHWSTRRMSLIHWWTKDGRKLMFTEMETSHIESCIKMLRGSRDEDSNAMFALKMELKRRNSLGYKIGLVIQKYFG